MTLSLRGTFLASLAFGFAVTTTAPANSAEHFIGISDAEFAEEFADMAFSDSLEDQSAVAWMLFARANQQIANPAGGTSSKWQAWASDPDTFQPNPSFEFNEVPRDDPHFVTSKKVLAGAVDTEDPSAGGEEVNRNQLSYDYVVGKGLNTKAGVAAYFKTENAFVDAPIGAVEIKARWAQADEPDTEGAYLFKAKSGTYALVGLHIMAKMRPTPKDTFRSEDPSWFWTTFEFDGNVGLNNVRSLITYTDALSPTKAIEILELAGLKGLAFDRYSPNGTQIRFSDDDGKTAIILGHSKMEDFAGVNINLKAPAGEPSQWTMFNSSCHACHSTAAYNPATDSFTQMPLVAGQLPDAQMEALAGFKPLDFLWPIPFQAK